MDDSTNYSKCQLNTNTDQKAKKEYHLYNKQTGKYFTVDNHKKSMKQLRSRIFSFAEVTSKTKDVLGNTYILIQLSYADNRAWKSKQITEYLQSVIKLVGRDNVYDYAWVLEIKPVSRKLHYHVALHVKSSVFVPYPDKSGMWKWGSSNLYRGKSSPYYLAKYTSKEAQKYAGEYPLGARKYSTWLNRKHYSESQIAEHRLSAYPSYVVEKILELGVTRYQLKRGKDGGWVLMVLDTFHDLRGLEIDIASPWVLFRTTEELTRYLPKYVQMFLERQLS
jgi:hypothetical protein